MKEKMVTMPELGLIAGTRVTLGVGLGLLLADHLDTEQRHAVGWTLFAVGALSTIPLAAEVLLRQPPGNGSHWNQTLKRLQEPVNTGF